MALKGWISGPLSDAPHLEDWGVKLGEYDGANEQWDDCLVPDSFPDDAEDYWGIWLWGLYPVEIETDINCPVCGDVMDTITHQQPVLDDTSIKSFAGVGRAIHRGKSPKCVGDERWFSEPAVRGHSSVKPKRK